MRKAIVTKKIPLIDVDLKKSYTVSTAEVLVHGINFGRNSAIVEYVDGTMDEVSIHNVKFLDKPEDAQLTKMVTILVAGAMANGDMADTLGSASPSKKIQRAVEFAKEIILQTK